MYMYMYMLDLGLRHNVTSVDANNAYLDSKVSKKIVSLIVSIRINKIKYIFKIIREVY